MRASAVKEGFLRITGRIESGPSTADSGLSCATTDVLLLNSFSDWLRTCRGRDGNGLCVLVVGIVLDLESDDFNTRSDVW